MSTPASTRNLSLIGVNRCRCGAKKPVPAFEGLSYTLTCSRCERVASAFDWGGVVAAWNGEELAPTLPRRRFVACPTRCDFESDHPGPFEHVCDEDGNELEDYANSRTQEDWLLWLRAQATAVGSAAAAPAFGYSPDGDRTYAEVSLDQLRALSSQVDDVKMIRIDGPARKVGALMTCAAATRELVQEIDRLNYEVKRLTRGMESV